MSFGAPFCRGVEPFLANLKALLGEAARLELSTWPVVVSAQAVYDDIDGFLVYVPWAGDDCTRHTREVQAAITSLSAFLRSVPGASLNVPRPDVEPASEYELVPTWVKLAGFGVLGIAALHYLTPFFRSRRFAGRRGRR